MVDLIWWFLIFVVRNAILKSYSLYSAQLFAVNEHKDLYLANATTENLGEYSKSALKMSFTQRAQIFHVGR